MRVIRNIAIGDAAVRGFRLISARDDLLPAAYARGAPPKTCALGSTWRGSLGRDLDLKVESVEQLVSQIGVTPQLIDLGMTWTGDLTAQLRDADREAAGAQDDVVDTSEVRREADGLRAALESVAGGGGRQIGSEAAAIRIQDRIGRLRGAIARAGRGRATDAMNPLTRLARISDEQRALGPKLNEQARKFHAQQSAPVTTRPIGDSSGRDSPAFRDAHAAVLRAQDPYELNAALNAQAAAWYQQRA
jgi:hypothetical protein